MERGERKARKKEKGKRYWGKYSGISQKKGRKEQQIKKAGQETC